MTTDEGWALLGTLVRRRREYLELRQGDLAQYGGPGVSTVGKIERGEQGHFPLRTRQQLEIALGWRRGMVGQILEAPEEPWWDHQGIREDFIDGVVTDDVPDLTHPAGPTGRVHRAADLTDDELLAELTFRMKRYANERTGEPGGDSAPKSQAGESPADEAGQDVVRVTRATVIDEAEEPDPRGSGRRPGTAPRGKRRGG